MPGSSSSRPRSGRLQSLSRGWGWSSGAPLNGRFTVCRTSAGGDVVASVRFDHATLVVHVPRSNPVGQRVGRPVLVAPLRPHVEVAIGAQELLAPPTIGRGGVGDLASGVPGAEPVAGETF